MKLSIEDAFEPEVLEKTLESPLDYKEIKPVNLKRNQSWIFIRRTDAEAPILWPPDVDSQLIRKDPDAGKIEDRRRKRRQRTKWVDGITDSLDVSLSKLWEMVNDREAWHSEVYGSQRVGHNWTATIFHCVQILHCLHLSLIGHIGHLHVLSIMNNAAVTLGIQLSLQHWYNFFRKYIPRSGMAESYSSWFLISLKLSAVSHSHQWDISVHFLHILTNTCYLLSFW